MSPNHNHNNMPTVAKMSNSGFLDPVSDFLVLLPILLLLEVTSGLAIQRPIVLRHLPGGFVSLNVATPNPTKRVRYLDLRVS